MDFIEVWDGLVVRIRFAQLFDTYLPYLTQRRRFLPLSFLLSGDDVLNDSPVLAQYRFMLDSKVLPMYCCRSHRPQHSRHNRASFPASHLEEGLARALMSALRALSPRVALSRTTLAINFHLLKSNT